MTLALRVLIGLVAGFLLGLAMAGDSSGGASTAISILGSVGTIFVNLIRMTVVPLVVSMVIASVGSMASSGALGRTGVRGAPGIVAVGGSDRLYCAGRDSHNCCGRGPLISAGNPGRADVSNGFHLLLRTVTGHRVCGAVFPRCAACDDRKCRARRAAG